MQVKTQTGRRDYASERMTEWIHIAIEWVIAVIAMQLLCKQIALKESVKFTSKFRYAAFLPMALTISAIG